MLNTNTLCYSLIAVACMTAGGAAEEAADRPLGSTIVLRPAQLPVQTSVQMPAQMPPSLPPPLPKAKLAAAPPRVKYSAQTEAPMPTPLEPDGSEMVTIEHEGSCVTGSRHVHHSHCSYHSPCSHCRITMRDRTRIWWEEKKACLQYSHWGYPEEFEERPLGQCVCAHLKTQITNGLVGEMALYRYDFRNEPDADSSQLNRHGKRRLLEFVELFQCDIHPLVIESAEDDPQLDAARRAHVVAFLQEWMGEIPEQWVVVGRPTPRGLRYEEGVDVYGNMLQNTRTRGSQSQHGRIQPIAP